MDLRCNMAKKMYCGILKVEDQFSLIEVLNRLKSDLQFSQDDLAFFESEYDMIVSNIREVEIISFRSYCTIIICSDKKESIVDIITKIYSKTNDFVQYIPIIKFLEGAYRLGQLNFELDFKNMNLVHLFGESELILNVAADYLLRLNDPHGIHNLKDPSVKELRGGLINSNVSEVINRGEFSELVFNETKLFKESIIGNIREVASADSICIPDEDGDHFLQFYSECFELSELYLHQKGKKINSIFLPCLAIREYFMYEFGPRSFDLRPLSLDDNSMSINYLSAILPTNDPVNLLKHFGFDTGANYVVLGRDFCGNFPVVANLDGTRLKILYYNYH